MYGTDPVTGEPVALQTSDGKLVVEVSGGGGGTADTVLIQGKDGTVKRDVKVDAQGRIVIEKTAIEAKNGATQVPLAATGAGALIVSPATDAAVLMRAKNGAALEDVTKSALGLEVDIKSSITVPVAVQGVAEVKATSANWWAIGRGLGPVIVPGLSDSEGWIDVRPFSRVSATGIGQTYTYDLADGFVLRSGTTHRVTTYAELTSAITAATAGDTIFLVDGTYELPATLEATLLVDKSVAIVGQSRDGVVIQTPVQTAPGSTYVITIAADNVQIRNLTVYHRQTAPSGGASESCIRTDAARTGDVLDSLRLRYMEYGLTLRGQFTVRACDFEYQLADANNSHRAIILYGTSGECKIVDCGVSFGTYAAASQGRFVQIGAVVGSDYSGELILARNYRTAGRCNSVVYIESLPGTAGAFDLALVENTFAAEATNIIVISGADTLGEVTLQDNVASTALKGYLGFDVARTSPLTLHESGNTVTDPTLRGDYVEVYGGWLVAARDIVTPVPTVTADAIIPDFDIPADTGESVLIYADTTVALEYRVERDEPYDGEIAAHKLHTAHHHIVPPLEPQDILGVGWVRFNATNLHTDPGGSFAIFGVAK
jgi:hypothetical protein